MVFRIGRWFLLYYDPEVIKELDVKFFVKVDREIIKKRRKERTSYITVEDGFFGENLEKAVETVIRFVKKKW
ncbi:hypothetical protein C2G38_2239951 [Gigaspora rosea]|uniref:P-loop containing nucleoside triphosphate hydrolase protein n=1 Tax=Gigaspora rosea TaxID=44941 RepID=A0A397VYW7_9GLOM|nr:hypothetical protein C2G38_2239951 [Gigaspora rosea]CAG8548242.1 24531_t:CDS:2 [Gigaspora rosea]